MEWLSYTVFLAMLWWCLSCATVKEESWRR
jgi:hypothetical protein